MSREKSTHVTSDIGRATVQFESCHLIKDLGLETEEEVAPLICCELGVLVLE